MSPETFANGSLWDDHARRPARQDRVHTVPNHIPRQGHVRINKQEVRAVSQLGSAVSLGATFWAKAIDDVGMTSSNIGRRVIRLIVYNDNFDWRVHLEANTLQASLECVC